jgi:hypothetical protein
MNLTAHLHFVTTPRGTPSSSPRPALNRSHPGTELELVCQTPAGMGIECPTGVDPIARNLDDRILERQAWRKIAGHF